MSIEVVAIGTNEAAIHLDRHADRIGDWPQFWPEVVDAFTRREEIWFNTKGKGSWPPLSEKYAQWKAVHYPGKPTLVRSGDLKDSLTDPELAELVSNRDSLYLGSVVDYAIYHHSMAPRRRLARRALWPSVYILAAGFSRRLLEWVRYEPRRR